MNYQLGKEKKFFSEKLPRPRTNYQELPILVKKLPNRNVESAPVFFLCIYFLPEI